MRFEDILEESLSQLNEGYFIKDKPARRYDGIPTRGLSEDQAERKYGHRDSVSIAIQYRKQDGWKTKTNIDGDVYAVTDKNIPLSIIRDITGGI